MVKKHRKIRTKKQWSYYFKENFLALNPYTFSNLNSRKWEKLKIRFFKQYWRLNGVGARGRNTVKKSENIRKYAKKSVSTKQQIRRFKTYYKVSLKNKHKFKVFFNIKTEKKFKNFLRTSFKYKKKSDAFYNKLERRLDIFLVNSLFFNNLESARIFIKNGAVLVNGVPITRIDYLIRNIDIVGIIPQFHVYIYNNLKNSILMGKKFKKTNEINLRTLEVIPCGQKNQTKGSTSLENLISSPIAFNLIQKSYKR